MQPGSNPFTSPSAPGGGEKAPRPRDMVGALVAYAPKKITLAGTEDNREGVGGSEPRDRVTADLIILEAPGPVVFGGSPEYERDPKPHTHSVTGPAKFSGVWVSNTNIVRALAPGGVAAVGAMVLGRIVRSEIGNRPFNLVAVDGTPDMDKAVQIYSALNLGQLKYNDPVPLSGYAAPANSVQYAAPAQQAYVPPVAPELRMDLVGMYGGVPQQEIAARNAAALGQPAPPVDPNYLAWQAQQAQAAAVQAAGVAAAQAAFPGAGVIAGYPVAPAGPVGPPPPPGWQQSAWDTLTAEQKAQVLAAMPAPF